MGAPFVSQIARIFLDMLTLYKAVSAMISQSVASKGVLSTKTPLVRGMRSIKKDTLRLVESYVHQADDLKMIAENFTISLFEAILGDYRSNVEAAREPEVLNVTAAIVSKLGSLIQDLIPAMLDAVFQPTLSMINKDFGEYPEHRVGLFKLIQEINTKCFPALLKLPAPQFKLIVDSIVWAFKHTMRDIGDTGLSICYELLSNIARTEPAVYNGFYQAYLLGLLQDVFFVLTDSDHKSGFKTQALILAHIFHVVDSGIIGVPLYDPSAVGASPTMNNSMYLRDYVTNLLHAAFPHLQRTQVEIFVRGLFDLNRDIETFKAHLRDFLIQLKEFAGDHADLFREEMELEQERKAKAEMEVALMIPGMVKPADRPDEMDD